MRQTASAALAMPLGHAHGGPAAEPPTLASLLLTSHPDPFGILAGVVPAALFLLGVAVLRRRGDAWPVQRTLSFLAGCAAILLVTCTGLGPYSMALFSVHMVQHMVLNMVAPALLALGAPVTLTLRTLPFRPRRRLLRVMHSRTVRVIAHPLLISGIFVLSLYALYFTPLFSLAMSTHWGHLAMQMHFLVSGFAFYWLVLGVDPDPRRPSALARVPLLIGVMLGHTAFAVVLVFGTGTLGVAYFNSLDLQWEVARSADQALGGGIAWTLGEFSTVAVLVRILLRWFTAAERADAARARGTRLARRTS